MPKRPQLRLVTKSDGEVSLPAQDAKLFHDMLDGWYDRRCGTLRHTEKSVLRDWGAVCDFVRLTRKAPWRWTMDDFDQWCRQIGLKRGLAMSTQRQYQTAVRSFLDYVTSNVRFTMEVQERYGVPLRQICTDENCIPHVLERELASERRAMTHEEIEIFFKTLDRAIDEAARFASKDYRPLQRDKAFFYLMYVTALRISEAAGLNTQSFSENAEIPQFKKYGRVIVWGKGSRGSGPKQRTVIVDHPGLPEILEWYFEKVRPHIMRRADPNEDAAFLSERGKRICVSALEARFQHILQLAGLDGKGFVPHCLRHSSITHGGMLMSGKAMQHKAGHAYGSTTEGYADYPDEYIQDQVHRSIHRQIEQRKREDESNGQ